MRREVLSEDRLGTRVSDLHLKVRETKEGHQMVRIAAGDHRIREVRSWRLERLSKVGSPAATRDLLLLQQDRMVRETREGRMPKVDGLRM